MQRLSAKLARLPAADARAVLLFVNQTPLVATAAGTCGHHAVRHLQDAQLRKVHGAEYDIAHEQYKQRREAGSLSLTGDDGSRQLAGGSQRHLQAGSSAQQPMTRLQMLLQANQASTLRMQPVYQLQDSYLSTQQQAQLRDILVPGAIRILQQYIKVGGRVGQQQTEPQSYTEHGPTTASN